jgi:hypothetical protein
MSRRRGLVVLSPPATEETGAMSRVIESRQGIGWLLLKNYPYISEPRIIAPLMLGDLLGKVTKVSLISDDYISFLRSLSDGRKFGCRQKNAASDIRHCRYF